MQRLSHKPESTIRCMQSDLYRVREVLYQNIIFTGLVVTITRIIRNTFYLPH